MYQIIFTTMTLNKGIKNLANGIFLSFVFCIDTIKKAANDAKSRIKYVNFIKPAKQKKNMLIHKWIFLLLFLKSKYTLTPINEKESAATSGIQDVP